MEHECLVVNYWSAALYRTFSFVFFQNDGKVGILLELPKKASKDGSYPMDAEVGIVTIGTYTICYVFYQICSSTRTKSGPKS